MPLHANTSIVHVNIECKRDHTAIRSQTYFVRRSTAVQLVGINNLLMDVLAVLVHILSYIHKYVQTPCDRELSSVKS